jgi:hypothetical protein
MKFSEHIRNLRHKPDFSIISALDNGTFPLAGNGAFGHNPGLLAADEFKRCHDLFERRMPYEFSLSEMQQRMQMFGKFMSTLSTMQRLEQPNAEQLQQIAVDVIREMYDVPEDLLLNANLEQGSVEDPDTDQEQDVQALNLTEERAEYIQKEIQKRVILNGLVHGSSMHIWKSAHYIVQEKISQINPMLMDLYNEYSAMVGFLLWKQPISFVEMGIDEGIGMMTQGKCELEFKEEGNEVTASAVNFPVLLHEVNKGVMDYLISRAIPQDLTEAELDYYYAEADNYKHEIWHYFLSPSLWANLLDTLQVDSTQLPQVIANLSEMKYDTLVEMFQEMIDNKEKAKVKLEVWKII